jgi:endoglycosylceramidase
VRRPLLVLLVLLALVALPSLLADAVSLQVVVRGQTPSSPAATSTPLPWLHVEHPAGDRPFVADQQGRYRILRGVVAAGLIDFWSGADRSQARPAPFYPIDPAAYAGRCPANYSVIRVPPLCEEDFRQMRELGFDVVKLGLSWSLLEPSPGRYDGTYLDRIQQVVRWARDSDIYVILDMHQNAWSRYFPDDSRSIPGGLAEPPSLSDHTGAPAWAVFTDGLPSARFLGQRELNAAVQAAMTNFWLDRSGDSLPQGEAPGIGLQDHYIGALAALARRFRDDSTVAGYSLFNEPQQGFLPFGMFEDAFLMPFYRRVIDALTGAGDGLPCSASSPAFPACGYPDLGIHDRRHIFFLDANQFRELTDLPTHMALPLSTYPNLVYGLHAYTHVYTLDRAFGADPASSPYPFSYDQSLRLADIGARLTGAALMITEYGDDPGDDPVILRQEAATAERYLAGTTFWTWKENCGAGNPWGVYAGVYPSSGSQHCSYDRGRPDSAPKPVDGGLRPARARLLVRGYPAAVDGILLSYSYDPYRGGFTMRARAAGLVPSGARARETVVYLPADAGGQVSVTGLALVDGVEPAPGGGRLVYVAPTGPGDYSVSAGG